MTCWCGGNTGSYAKHRRRGQDPCDEAKAARREYKRQRNVPRPRNKPQPGWVVGESVLVEDVPDPL